jgi:uncharacterized radical SAM superfamily Fe-S cluster-containing enzyme
MRASLVARIADLAWKAFQAVNTRISEGELPQPIWAPGKIVKSRERSSPPLGFPRITDSLCPRCVPEIRDRIAQGEADVGLLLKSRPCEIKAELVEEGGRILMRKVCEKHGAFEDVLSTNPAFYVALKALFSGFQTVQDETFTSTAPRPSNTGAVPF